MRRYLASSLWPALLLAAICRAEPAPDVVSIELREQVVVLGAVYRLADVAVVRGNPDTQLALGQLELGRAPRPGYWADVTRQQIAARIERAMPEMRNRIAWVGDASVRVSAAGTTLPGGDVVAFADRALVAAVGRRHDDFTVELLDEVRDLIVPAGRVDLRAADLQNATLTPRMPVWVDILVDGQRQRSVPVWFRVSAWEDVVTVTQDLDRHHVLAQEDLIVESRDVTSLRVSPARDLEAVVGLRLTAPLRAGGVLGVDDTERVPIVQEGARVEVLASAGRVWLTASAVALADGEVDEQIPVRSVSSGERYLATVLASGYLQAN